MYVSAQIVAQPYLCVVDHRQGLGRDPRHALAPQEQPQDADVLSVR